MRVLVIILDLILSGLPQSFTKLLVNTSEHIWEGEKQSAVSQNQECENSVEESNV